MIVQLRRLIVYSTNQDLCPAISSGIPDALHRTDAVVRVFTLWWNFVHSTTTTDFHPTQNYSDILTCTTKSIFLMSWNVYKQGNSPFLSATMLSSLCKHFYITKEKEGPNKTLYLSWKPVRVHCVQIVKCCS